MSFFYKFISVLGVAFLTTQAQALDFCVILDEAKAKSAIDAITGTSVLEMPPGLEAERREFFGLKKQNSEYGNGFEVIDENEVAVDFGILFDLDGNNIGAKIGCTNIYKAKLSQEEIDAANNHSGGDDGGFKIRLRR